MSPQSWQETRLSRGSEDQVWELFHENSKIGRFSRGLSDEEIQRRMKDFHESLEFIGYPVVELPRPFARLKLSLAKAISTRVSSRHLTPYRLSLRQLATLLHYAYGVNRDNKGTDFPRPFRVVPSGGALYPLELFFHSTRIEGISAGLYHYSPAANHLRLLRAKDEKCCIAHAMAYPELVLEASLIIFITANFERSVFKYGDRGYRFVLLEAGHIAQNINLISNGLGLGSINIGGFFDRDIDNFLGLDGVTHSTVYIIAVGKKTKSKNIEHREE